MYAIIESGGKQYQIEEGDVIEVELLNDENGATVEFNKVLFINNNDQIKVGLPYLENCIVQGELMDKTLGPKVIAYKYKRRKNFRKKIGHRQKYSKVKITKIKQS